MSSLSLEILDGTFAVCRLHEESPLPAWAAGSPFCCLARTAEELSIVCPEDRVPEGVRAERGWRCLRVAGTLDFAEVGVLAALLAPLAGAGIPVFVVSTFETDYLLVKGDRFDAAV